MRSTIRPFPLLRGAVVTSPSMGEVGAKRRVRVLSYCSAGSSTCALRRTQTGKSVLRTERNSGIALLLVLWIVIIMTAVVISFGYQAKMEVKMMSYQMSQMRARYIARAGLARALVYIREDALKDYDAFPEDRDPIIEIPSEDEDIVGPRPYDAYMEAWHYHEDEDYYDTEEFGDEFDFGPGKLKVTVFDESGRLNLNSPLQVQGAADPLLARQDVVRALLIYLGNDEDTAQAVSAAIVDWVDEDDIPCDGGDEFDWGDEESEETYYNPEQDRDDIADFGPQYINKNGPLDIIDELLLVKGMTPLIFYGEDANGNGELDDNEDDGDANPPADNADGELLLGLKDYVTVFSNRMVNLNTAPKEVIAALLYPLYGEEDEDRAMEIAEDIVEYRAGFDGEEGTDDDKPTRTMDIIEGENHFTEVDNFEQSDYGKLAQGNIIAVASDYFRVVSTGEYNGIKETLTAVVWREYNENRLTKAEELGLESQDDEELPQKVVLTILNYQEGHRNLY